MSRPTVTLKLATSLDGRIATAAGESRWITGERARAQTHRMRAAHDAILIGIGTALADDPELTVRGAPPPLVPPIRVVLDRAARLPPGSRLAGAPELGRTLVLAGPGAAPGWIGAAQVIPVRPAPGQGEISAALDRLAAEGVGSVFVEGGGQIAASFLREGVVDRLEWFRAPLLLGAEGRPAIGGLGFATLAEAPRLQRTALRALGPDVWETYHRA